MFTPFISEKRQEDREMENFYNECIYDIQQNTQKRLGRMADVKILKPKIVKLRLVRMEGANLDVDDRAAFNDERAPIYHIIKQNKRREQLTITRLMDQADRTQTTNRG
jgi:hypothetical protein